MENKVDVSIVIVCMNRLDNLYPCLESIRSHTSVSYETFVVAYLFNPENLAKAREDFPWVRFIESNEIRGFSENNNLALRQCSGRFCLVLNDDTEFSDYVIDRLVSDMGRLPADTAIVSPRLLNADGSLQLCGRPPYPSRYYALQQWHMHTEPIDDTVGKVPEFDRVFRTSNITGACFLIKRDVFESLGWFDERYFFTPEDIALSTTAGEAGYSVWVDADVCITHKWKTTASRISPAVRPAAVKGSLIFFGRRSASSRMALSLAVWCAESVKMLKAAVRYRLHPTDDNRIKLLTFKHIVAEIFSGLTPKEIFTKYYNG